jgi:hypothetical protein
MLGTAVAVGGTVGARLIRDFLVVASGGSGYEMRQSQFIAWGISAVAQVVGGGIAGANTRSGAAYGFRVGLPAAVLLVIVQVVADLRTSAPAVLGWLLGVSVVDGSGAALLIQGVQALILGVVGGWLGGLILPAIPPKRRPDGGAS